MSRKTVKTYVVTETSGVVHYIDCDYMFNNNGELVFRSGQRGQSEVSAIFHPGMWTSCVKAKPTPVEPPKEPI
jgi:isopentenyldiphosphate isomerase